MLRLLKTTRCDVFVFLSTKKTGFLPTERLSRESVRGSEVTRERLILGDRLPEPLSRSPPLTRPSARELTPRGGTGLRSHRHGNRLTGGTGGPPAATPDHGSPPVTGRKQPAPRVAVVSTGTPDGHVSVSVSERVQSTRLTRRDAEAP